MTTSVAISPVRAFEVEVVAAERLSPTYLRVTFGGSALGAFHDFGPIGPRDLRIKVLVPAPDHSLPDLSDLSDGWYQRWLALDPAVRGAMRTYTVRQARLGGADPQIDIDFVLHLDDAGPASAWAAQARPGDRITLIGPNAGALDYGGIEWRPPAPSVVSPPRVLLVGDETAVPAICSILESMPTGYDGHAILEVPYAEDFQDVRTASNVEISWLARTGRPHGAPARQVVADLLEDLPVGGHAEVLPDLDVDTEVLWESSAPAPVTGGEFYAWIAGEAGVVRALRRHLVRDVRIDRRDVAFMGYWRLGRAQ